jgi:hypothetical protein
MELKIAQQQDEFEYKQIWKLERIQLPLPQVPILCKLYLQHCIRGLGKERIAFENVKRYEA